VLAVQVVTPTRIVFICSGNICRSPMAAALGERALREAGIEAAVISAGMLGIQGSPAAAHAVEVMREIDIDIGGHRSQGLSPQIAKLSDHLVVMSPIHRSEILSRDPSLESKVQPFWRFATPSDRFEEIADPVGMDRAAFLVCRQDLEACLDGWVRHIQALHRG
jgi:protein-tyrosine phosphatase